MPMNRESGISEKAKQKKIINGTICIGLLSLSFSPFTKRCSSRQDLDDPNKNICEKKENSNEIEKWTTFVQLASLVRCCSSRRCHLEFIRTFETMKLCTFLFTFSVTVTFVPLDYQMLIIDVEHARTKWSKLPMNRSTHTMTKSIALNRVKRKCFLFLDFGFIILQSK